MQCVPHLLHEGQKICMLFRRWKYLRDNRRRKWKQYVAPSLNKNARNYSRSMHLSFWAIFQRLVLSSHFAIAMHCLCRVCSKMTKTWRRCRTNFAKLTKEDKWTYSLMKGGNNQNTLHLSIQHNNIPCDSTALCSKMCQAYYYHTQNKKTRFYIK